MTPTFFETAAKFRAWLSKHAASEAELIAGFFKRGSGLPSMTWQESVDEALCVGWIDGVRTRLDDQSYKIRFTPRRPASTWSSINVERARALEAEGRMKRSGRAAFELRREDKSGIYAYEQSKTATLDPNHEARFRKNKAAWKFFEAQPPSYRHLVIWRIVSAKRAETREARLAQLIEASKNGRRL